MPCRNCKYFDENETSGSKGYCEYIGIYVYSDDDTCSHYAKRGSGGGCFMTTACCEYYGLPDDCRELTMMRRLRDNYMRYTDEGRKAIDEYYRTAPAVIDKINASSEQERKEIYEYIYSCITKCASFVEADDTETAERSYQQMFTNVKKLLS